MYAVSDEESRCRGGPGSGVGPCQELEPRSWPWSRVAQGGGFPWRPGTTPNMQLGAFPEPPTSLLSSLCVACSLSHSSSAKFIFSLLLPRSQDCRCTHVAWLPGQGGWGWWAGKGGFNLGGRVEVSTPSNPRPMSQGVWAPLLGLRARLEFKWEEHGAWCPDRAKGFLEGVRGYMELVVWSLGFPRASGAWVLEQSEDKRVDTWIPEKDGAMDAGVHGRRC